MRQRLSEQFDRWLERTAQSQIAPFERFARSLKEDYDAVKVGVTLETSNGQVEGQIKTTPTWIYLVASTGVALLAGSTAWYLRKRRQMTPLRLVSSFATSPQTIQVAQTDK